LDALRQVPHLVKPSRAAIVLVWLESWLSRVDLGRAAVQEIHVGLVGVDSAGERVESVGVLAEQRHGTG